MTKVCEHKLRPTFKDNIIFETDAEKQNDDGSDTTMSDKIRSVLYSQYCELAKACWSHDQNMRPSIDYILKVLTEIEDELNVMSKNNSILDNVKTKYIAKNVERHIYYDSVIEPRTSYKLNEFEILIFGR